MLAIVAKDILPSIRYFVGALLPEVKKAHIAEALAAGFGHASNASFLAWLVKIPAYKPPQAVFDPSVAVGRLRCLAGGIDVAETVFAESLLQSGALVTGLPMERQIERAEGMLHSCNGEWGVLDNQLRLAHAASLLHASMAKTGNGMVDFVREHTETGDGNLHIRLAACVQTKRDLDREIADYLAEFLLAAETEAWSDEARERLAWGDRIYRAYAPRIGSFLDMSCRTWHVDANPLEMSPAPQMLKRLGRPPVIVTGISSRDHEFGIFDTGQSAPSIETLVGICCMALLRSGAAKHEISDFACKEYASERKAIEACLSMVAFNEGCGMDEACGRLSRLLVPDLQGCAPEGGKAGDTD